MGPFPVSQFWIKENFSRHRELTFTFDAVAEVVNCHNIVVLLEQFVNAMRTDISRSARDENRLALSAHLLRGLLQTVNQR